MLFPRTEQEGFQVHWLPETTSTNDDLRTRAQEQPPAPEGTTVVSGHQTLGRGRQGRSWQTPRGTALAASTLMTPDPDIPPGWVPLLTGAAVIHALTPLWKRAQPVALKWPNDVHTLTAEGELGKKLCGILCELLPDGRIIVGVGTNLFMREAELPTIRAGSLLSEGAQLGGATHLMSEAGARVADSYLARLLPELKRLTRLASTDPESAARRIRETCHTIGSRVRLHLPGGEVQDGLAVGLRPDGALEVRLEAGKMTAVHAGDVEHLRPAPATAHEHGEE